MISKLGVFLSLLMLTNTHADSNQMNTFWSGTMEMNGKIVDISFDFSPDNHTLSSTDLMLLNIPISNLKIKNDTISFKVVLGVEMDFTGTITGNSFTGTTALSMLPPGAKITFSAKQAEKPVKPYSVEKLTINSKDVTLAAEVFKPLTPEKHPALVLLHGSSISPLTNYRFIADSFAKLGFEVLIFDKRGCGNSTGSYDATIYNDLRADAIACLETMHKRESVDKAKIGIWGISQGGMLLPKIITETDIPKFLIAMSPETNSVVEAAAFADSLRVMGFGGSESDAKIVTESHRKVGKMILEGKSHSEVEAFIRENARQHSFMDQTGLYGSIRIGKDDFKGFYWHDRAEDFHSYWPNIKIPTLVLFGGMDNLVNAKENYSTLKGLDNDCLELKIFPDADHNLQKGFNPASAEFDWPRIVDGYYECVEEWVKREIGK